MDNISVTLELKDLLSILLLMILAYLGFRVAELKWSYKISKPYKWDQAVKSGEVSRRLKKLERRYRDKVRFYTIYFQIERLKSQDIKGAFAELGVYQGETAEFIHEMDPARDFYLFDTFEGFKQKDLQQERSSDPKYAEDNFSDTSVEEVKEKLGASANLHFCPGFFPESAHSVPHQSFAFVHLDADLYAPSLAALEYFYPLMSAGGVILIHDYNHTWPGMRKAVDEFLLKIPESPVEISDWQGSILIVKNR